MKSKGRALSRREMLKLSGAAAAGSLLGAKMIVGDIAAAEQNRQQATKYDVVTPLGQSTVKLVRPNAPIADLKGKTIGFIDVEFGGYRSQEFMRDVEALCQEKIPGVKVVELPSNVDGVWHSRPIDGTSGQVAKAAKVDAVIVGIGG